MGPLTLLYINFFIPLKGILSVEWITTNLTCVESLIGIDGVGSVGGSIVDPKPFTGEWDAGCSPVNWTEGDFFAESVD